MEYIIIILLLAIFIYWRAKPVAGVDTITTAQLKEKLKMNKKDIILLDVRTAAEYSNRHIPSSKNMPLGSDYTVLPKNKEIIVICQSGMRSSQACKQLKKLGYSKLTNVRGGMNAY